MANYISSDELNNLLFSFNKNVEAINRSTDIEKCKIRFISNLKNMKRLINDIEINTDIELYYSDIFDLLDRYINRIKNIDTKENLLEVKNYLIEDNERLLSSIKPLTESRLFNLNNTILAYKESINNINPTSLEDIILTKIALSIISKREVNLFDPQCGDGKNYEMLSDLLSPIQTYGLDNEDYGIYFAKDRMSKVIIGELKGSKISNKCFDILFVNPRISLVKDKKSLDSNEKYMLKNTLKFLKHNGIFIYTIPFYRMTLEMWLYISKNLQEISVFKHCDEQKKITIMGYKSSNPNHSQIFNEFKNLDYTDIISFRSFNKKYTIEGKLDEVPLFRGSILDMNEIKDLIENDGLYKDFFNSSKIEKEKITNTNPLLPFNLGQIGLVLTSGQLNGIIKESQNSSHVIKGLTVRSTIEEEQSEDKNTVSVTRTVSNIVQINVVDGSGKIRTLM